MVLQGIHRNTKHGLSSFKNDNLDENHEKFSFFKILFLIGG